MALRIRTMFYLLLCFLTLPPCICFSMDFKVVVGQESMKRLEQSEVQKAIEDNNNHIRAERLKINRFENETTNRHAIYQRQLIYHPIVLGVVVVVVLSGVGLSALQAYFDVKFGVKNGNTLKIGKDGLELSSSVIGLITLVVSLVFFYIYLKEIYPITDVGSGTETTQSTPVEKSG